MKRRHGHPWQTKDFGPRPTKLYVGLAPRLRAVLALLLFSFGLPAEVIEFESGSLRYQTLMRNGATVISAQLLSHAREYSILQVAN